jgi:hypothetical protein
MPEISSFISSFSPELNFYECVQDSITAGGQPPTGKIMGPSDQVFDGLKFGQNFGKFWGVVV